MNAQSTQGSTGTHDTPPEVDAIVAALAQLRGRRHHPGDPRRGGPHGHDPRMPGAHGPGPFGFPLPPGAAGEALGGDPHHPNGDPARGFGGGPGGRERFGGPALLRMLGTLAHADEPLTVSEIADAIGVDQPRASRLVQQAVAKGFALREADPEDARRTRVRLTEAGTLAVHGFRGRQREDVSTALEALEPEERTELARLMTKLAAAWPAR